ncbi:MAG: hypothetical protein K1X89_06560 [Myxococcaceae bacterium]|nr:hypothetical protein [Myxococcaceae bacterium]
MSVRLLAVERWVPGAEEPPRVKRAVPAGRALVALARKVPGLEPQRTGLYQALGPEKLGLTVPLFEQLAGEGFDAAGTTAPLFHYTPYGPVLSVALDLGCRGPFASLEGQGDEAVLAAGQAVVDLEAGRRRHALVVAVRADGAAALLALEAGLGLAIVRGFGASEAQLKARLEQRVGVALVARRLQGGGVAELGALLAEAARGGPVAAMAQAGENRWSGLAVIAGGASP